MKTLRFPILAILFLLTISNSFATIQEGFKFGKIPDEFVTMKVYETDPDAEAVVLSDVGNAKIAFSAGAGFQITYNIHKVIKVLTKGGVSYGDFRIPYYFIPGRTDLVGSVKGYVYNESGGTILKEKIGKEHIFEEEVSKTYRMKKISAPNIKEGSVIELSYEITSDLFSYLREWEFQTEIPTRWSEYSLEYPEYFSFSQSAQGFEQYVINEQSEGTGNANWTESERSEGRVAQSTTTNNSVNFSTRKYHWAIQNAPALRPEPFIDNPQSYATKIEFQLQYLQFPNSQRQTFSGSWNTMSEELLKDPEFGKQLERKKFVQEALPQLITAEQSEQEKMIAIADHLTRMVKWNGGSSIYPSQSLEKVYKEGVGNVADMNFLLIAFLREAGFEAHPVVGSTRANGFVNPSNPVMYKLNYLSALVKSGDKEFVMDISDSSLPFGFLPINGMNFRGWAVIPDNASRWVDIYNTIPTSETAMVTSKITEEQISTNVQKTTQGYQSSLIKSRIKATGEEKYKQEMTDEFTGGELISIQFENLDSKEKGITEKYEIKTNEGLVVSGENIYLNLFENSYLSENPFKLDSRVFPIDFIYPQKRQVILNFDIPEGYSVEEMPQSTMIQFNEKAIVYSFRTAPPVNGRITIRLAYQVNETLFKADEYQNLKDFFDLIASKQKEAIVLKKI
ncbi:DUF3857 domain-containing protein [Cognataquiflexum rubidum]|uniref:DUF3857 domain-containing protein n=1 Tax=Cognataquiflexum rubidum TaxID=2922273 RepID=UPI001F1454FF|nr:DUF3857 and transglutaminase domain-containing protein [Cognataquiflexum rubidum]MCH6232780.1 DUF3857 domain-containing protein [Cognataquiflexum rubidum]